ncbi:hypothetical protein KKB18_11130 [bacterium]|nr:hypothetical protein [bacterium]
MAKFDTKFLDSNEPFPGLRLNLIDGTALNFPHEAGMDYSVFLIYRGSW